MVERIIRFVICVLVVTAVTSPATASERVLIDDFGDGVDDGWTRSLTGKGERWGPGNFDASSGEYHLSTGLVEGHEFAALTAFWDDSEQDFYNDGTWRVRIRTGEPGTNVGILLRSGPDARGGYMISTSISGELNLFDCRGVNSCTYLNGRNVDFQAGEDWIIQASAVESMITAKMWKVGEAIPDEPQIRRRTGAFLEGQFGVVAFIGVNWNETAKLDGFFDDIYFTPAPVGDFNLNGYLDADDIDRLNRASEGERFDLNSDGRVDQSDSDLWVSELASTWFGDANLDGEFNTQDLVNVFQKGEYDDAKTRNSKWATGDWNGDREFDSSDFVFAFQDGGFEVGPRIAVASVPEPSSIILLGLSLLGTFRLRKM